MAARSRADTIWFCLRSITARAAGLDRKAKDWLATNGKRADSRPFHRPGRVVAGYSLMPNMPANRASATSRISRASRPKMTRAVCAAEPRCPRTSGTGAGRPASRRPIRPIGSENQTPSR